ncbi:MAG: hypothetical protein QOE04_336 [Mycobacterium sp.]|nr:hypothetical protein [Mycobacterium sp.]
MAAVKRLAGGTTRGASLAGSGRLLTSSSPARLKGTWPLPEQVPLVSAV